jgi:CRP-like cAMP-binding protein
MREQYTLTTSTISPHDRLIVKLESTADLTPSERDAVARIPITVRDVSENTDIVREGDAPSGCCLVIEGYACRYKSLREGQRQIMSFHMTGDIPDLQSLHLKVMDHSIGALTPMVVGYIPHDAMHDLIRSEPGLGSLFWRETLIDGAIFREWLVSQGRRTAQQQLAHLICELVVKMTAVGLIQDQTLVLPFTQQELGDAQGLSAVHVNRVLQELRNEHLITGARTTITVPDWARLQAFSEFDPTYLHVQRHAA